MQTSAVWEGGGVMGWRLVAARVKVLQCRFSRVSGSGFRFPRPQSLDPKPSSLNLLSSQGE